MYDKIAPEDPTKAPVIINAVFSNVNPIPATAAQPEYEFNIEITTGMSAPPIGMINKILVKKIQQLLTRKDYLVAYLQGKKLILQLISLIIN